jgi:hypothetical protein
MRNAHHRHLQRAQPSGQHCVGVFAPPRESSCGATFQRLTQSRRGRQASVPCWGGSTGPSNIQRSFRPHCRVGALPRALPWAGMRCPVGARRGAPLGQTSPCCLGVDVAVLRGQTPRRPVGADVAVLRSDGAAMTTPLSLRRPNSNRGCAERADREHGSPRLALPWADASNAFAAGLGTREHGFRCDAAGNAAGSGDLIPDLLGHPQRM